MQTSIKNGVLSDSFQCKPETAILLANEHHSDQKKCNKRFSQTFLLCDFVEFKAISKTFAFINHKDIHNMKKQAENILSSCSFLLFFLKNTVSFHIAVYFSTLS